MATSECELCDGYGWYDHRCADCPKTHKGDCICGAAARKGDAPTPGTTKAPTSPRYITVAEAFEAAAARIRELETHAERIRVIRETWLGGSITANAAMCAIDDVLMERAALAGKGGGG
jgi:histone acetyltransferase (RNA polymerase elongator complex component)